MYERFMCPQTAILHCYLMWPLTNILVLKKNEWQFSSPLFRGIAWAQKRIRRPSVFYGNRTKNATISKILQVKAHLAKKKLGFSPTEAKEMLANLLATAWAGWVEQRWLEKKKKQQLLEKFSFGLCSFSQGGNEENTGKVGFGQSKTSQKMWWSPAQEASLPTSLALFIYTGLLWHFSLDITTSLLLSTIYHKYLCFKSPCS